MKTNNTAPLSPDARRRVQQAIDDVVKALVSLTAVLHPPSKRKFLIAPLTPEQRRRNAALADEMLAIAKERVRPLPTRR